MKYLKQTYDRLIRGNFISRDSLSDHQRDMFRDIEDNLPEYTGYFERIGLILTEGDGFFYMTRSENRTDLARKLERFSHWIDVLDFLKAWDAAFGPGFRFKLSRLLHGIDADIELKDKAAGLYDNKDRNSEIASRLIDELLRQGFIETVDNDAEEYQATNAFLYLEELVGMLTFEESDDETA
ncbi:MAG: hypothetical protein K2J70_02475 [Muribaculaceae bacterium]|nr:hypothetical protein [Muribaculaceae bacterium]